MFLCHSVPNNSWSTKLLFIPSLDYYYCEIFTSNLIWYHPMQSENVTFSWPLWGFISNIEGASYRCKKAIVSNDEIEGIQVPPPPISDEITQRLVRADFNVDHGKNVLGDMGAIRLAMQNDVMNSLLKTTCNNTVQCTINNTKAILPTLEEKLKHCNSSCRRPLNWKRYTITQ